MTSARSRVNTGNDVSQLLLIVSDGRGIFLEGTEVSIFKLCLHTAICLADFAGCNKLS